MRKPLHSIFMQAFNEEKYISDTLDSLLQQSFGDFILYAVDNGSIDNTFSIIERFSKLDQRIVPIRLTQNDPRIAAKMIRRCKTKYCQYAAGHDIYDIKFLEKCVSKLESDEKVVLAYPMATFLFEDYEEQVHPIYEPLNSHPHIRAISCFTNIGYNYLIYGIIRCSALKKIKNWDHIPGIDNLLITQLALYGDFKIVTENLLHFRKVRKDHDVSDYMRKHAFEILRPYDMFAMYFRHFQEATRDFANNSDYSIFLMQLLCCLLLNHEWVFLVTKDNEEFANIKLFFNQYFLKIFEDLKKLLGCACSKL